jgi:predicted MFS family arabinose efflux permease
VTREGHGTADMGVDRPAAWLALIAIATFAPVTSGLLPAIVATLVDRQDFSAASAGHVSSLYSLAGMLAGLLGVLWIARADRRTMLLALVLLGFCADLSAVWLHGYTAIAAGRLATGFAGSSIIIVVNATIAVSPRSERLFGIVVASQALLSAALFFALPRLSWGVPQLFSVLALCWVVMAPFALLVPQISGPSVTEDVRDRPSPVRELVRPSVVLLALAFLCFYIATGALWTFLYLIGEWHGIGSTAVGSAMALGMLAAIPGGLMVTLLGKRYGRSAPLIVGLVANVAFTVVLLLPIGIAGYTLSVCATNLLFSFALVLFLALLGDEDPKGRLFSAGNVIIFGGLALGPWLFGSSTGGGSYRTLLIGTVGLFAASPALLFARMLLSKSRGARVAATPAPLTDVGDVPTRSS